MAVWRAGVAQGALFAWWPRYVRVARDRRSYRPATPVPRVGAMLHVRLTPEQVARVRALAAEGHVTASEAIRERLYDVYGVGGF